MFVYHSIQLVRMKDRIIHIPLFLSIFLISLPQSHSQENNKYHDCSQPFTCGTLPNNISYPFWDGAERPRYCGGRDQFMLTCEPNQLPSIHIGSQDFQVHLINIADYTMRMNRTDLAYEACDPPLANNTLTNPLFHYTQNDYNITVFYHCPSHVSSGTNNFTCFSQSKYGEEEQQYVFYVEDTQLYQYPELLKCEKRSQLQALGSAPVKFDAGVDGLYEAVESGFEVKYDIGEVEECKKCRESKGVCGRKETSNEYGFSCYCPDGTEISSSCSDNESMFFFSLFDFLLQLIPISYSSIYLFCKTDLEMGFKV